MTARPRRRCTRRRFVVDRVIVTGPMELRNAELAHVARIGWTVVSCYPRVVGTRVDATRFRLVAEKVREVT